MWLHCCAVHKGILTNCCYIRSAGFQKSWDPVSPSPGKMPNLFYPYMLFSVMSPPHSLLSRVPERPKLLPTHSYRRAHTHTPILSLAEDLQLRLRNKPSPFLSPWCFNAMNRQWETCLSFPHTHQHSWDPEQQLNSIRLNLRETKKYNKARRGWWLMTGLV